MSKNNEWTDGDNQTFFDGFLKSCGKDSASIGGPKKQGEPAKEQSQSRPAFSHPISSAIKTDKFGTPAAHEVGASERSTQNLAIEQIKALEYRFLDSKQHTENSNIEEDLLRANLESRGYAPDTIAKAIAKLRQAANQSGADLYDRNKAVYEMLRGGIRVKTGAGEKEETVWLIDWEDLEANDFAFAEEVTIEGILPGSHAKRPDIVIYVNGIALAMLELKRSSVSVGEGIRQCLDNQDRRFIEHFFSTNQLLLAGNPSEGLRYGAIGTKAKHYLEWQEETQIPEEKVDKLSRHLRQLLSRDRFMEIIYDFVMFDNGLKKLCRQNQYFAVKAVQKHIQEQIVGPDDHGQHIWKDGKRKGGIIWHTQGSGKSLTMLLIWRWIKEFDPRAKLLIITDRKELDEQIKKVFKSVEMNVHRAESGSDLVKALKSSESEHDAVCSLIHKFGTKERQGGDDPDAADRYVKEMKDALGGALESRNLYVYVDECHRTQSGKLHEAMSEMLPDAMLIGFTGTPLLKADKPSVDVFGPYIHRYQFPEAVRDKVVLDLLYEARMVPQSLGDTDKVDVWFEKKTQGLSPFAKAKIQKEWAKKQKVKSSKSRIEVIAQDIIFDFATKPRLMEGSRGNALLVADSIGSACQYYQEFQDSELKGRVAIVTSYVPSHEKIKGESTGDGDTDNLFKHAVYSEMIAEYMDCKKSEAANFAEKFETEVKRRFVEKPEQMRLLIVVDKLLTGFDAPSANYIYLDKEMRDHELFQAICRPNRPDQEDEGKEYGYIVDYRNLFGKIRSAMEDYADKNPLSGYDPEDVDGIVKDAAQEARKKMEELRAELSTLCAGVGGTTQQDYVGYFGPQEGLSAQELAKREQKRLVFYKTVEAFLRSVASQGNDLEAFYGEEKAKFFRQEAAFYEEASKAVKLSSGDYVDMKLYEPHMRRMIDQFITASPSSTLEGFEDLSLMEMLLKSGEDIDAAPKMVKEVIGKGQEQRVMNNVRALLVKSATVSASGYEKMSSLLEKLLLDLRKEEISYKEFLAGVRKLVEQIANPSMVEGFPRSIDTKAKQELYALLDGDEQAVLEVDAAIRSKIQPMWRTEFPRRKKSRSRFEARWKGYSRRNGERIRIWRRWSRRPLKTPWK